MTEIAEKFDAATAPYILVTTSTDGSKDIRIFNLTVRTPGTKPVTLVDNIDLTLKAGSRTVLTGASGSGKTLTAKGLLNQHDHGSGLIVMPDGTKIMSMSQQAYFPNINMRGILNITPRGHEKFADEELTAALTAVGHEKLVQQIPGQQTRLMMDALLEQAPEILSRFAEKPFDGSTQKSIRAALAPVIRKLIADQFSTVQYVPPRQAEYFQSEFLKTIARALNLPRSGADAIPLCRDLIADMDRELVRPLCDFLAQATVELAHAKRGKIIAYTPAKAGYFTWGLKRSLKKTLSAYLANEDTDDLQREIRINNTQADFITQEIAAKMHDQFLVNTRSTALTEAFSTVTWPISLSTVRAKAASTAKDITQRLTFFMDRQILRGENLTLSGGERQKLMIAMVLLHKPNILILDEITAALDRPTAVKLYAEMLAQIPPETTVLSIAHNEHIIKLHTHHAHLENKTITMRKVGEDNPETVECPVCHHPHPARPMPV